MKDIKSLLVPTDLTENSRRGLLYGCALAAKNQATLTVLHVANDLASWEYLADDALCAYAPRRTWPLDRVMSEAALELNRFLEPHMPVMKNLPRVNKRVVVGPIAAQIATAAQELQAGLVIMSPRRAHKLRHWMSGSVTDRVTRLCPCPVLSVTEPMESHNWRGRWATVLRSWTRQQPAAARA